jgi:ABC-type Fe3+/spermidine/putrescine transport system ATPase subunit
LDEPLSNLDAILREEMRTELRDLQLSLGITAVYVTHDQAEACSLSDRVVVMRDGIIDQIADPEVLYREPASAFVANFVGGGNVLQGVVSGTGRDLSVTIHDATSHALKASSAGTQQFAVGDPVDVCIRPGDVQLSRPSAGPITGTVKTVSYLGGHWEARVTVGATELRVFADDSLRPLPGEEVSVGFAKDVWLMPTP